MQYVHVDSLFGAVLLMMTARRIDIPFRWGVVCSTECYICRFDDVSCRFVNFFLVVV